MKISELLYIKEAKGFPISQDLKDIIKSSYINPVDNSFRTNREIASLPDVSRLLGPMDPKKAEIKVGWILQQYWPDRPKRKIMVPTTDDEVEAVKKLKDDGYSSKQIAIELYDKTDKKTIQRVNEILYSHYHERSNKKINIPVTQEEIVAAKTGYDQGKSKKEVALELYGNTDDSSINRISMILDTYYSDRKRKKTNLTDKDVEYAQEKFAEGQTFGQIASTLGRSETAVYNRLKVLPNYYTELLQKHMATRPKDPNVSAAENDLFDKLEKIGIVGIQRNFKIAREGRLFYNIDGLHASKPKIAIEFFGDLWHANPKRFKDPTQQLPNTRFTVGEIWLKDKAKIDYLTSQGYQVVVVWESDWRSKAGKLNAINEIRKAFDLDPITQEELKDLLLSDTPVNEPKHPTAKK